MKEICRFNVAILVVLLLVGLVSSSYASEPSPTFGSIAENLIAGTSVVTRLVHFICIVVGLGFLGMAVAQYKAHRFNPKFVPLERPIMYAVLGIVLISLPFFDEIFGLTGGTHDLEKKELLDRGVQVHDIDAPLDNWGNDYNH